MRRQCRRSTRGGRCTPGTCSKSAIITHFSLPSHAPKAFSSTVKHALIKSPLVATIHLLMPPLSVITRYNFFLQHPSHPQHPARRPHILSNTLSSQHAQPRPILRRHPTPHVAPTLTPTHPQQIVNSHPSTLISAMSNHYPFVARHVDVNILLLRMQGNFTLSVTALFVGYVRSPLPCAFAVWGAEGLYSSTGQ